MPRYRSHIALTGWPITALFVLELARMWRALRGASSFAAASPVTWSSLVAHTVVVVVISMALFVALGLTGCGPVGIALALLLLGSEPCSYTPLATRGPPRARGLLPHREFA